MFIYKNCPACGGQSFSRFLTCKDYTVSKEQFDIVSCKDCGLKFTNPIPEIRELGNYYKSEEYISHSNTKKGLVAKLYHFVRSYTLKKKLSLVNQFVSRGTLLDFGCGTGMFLKECSEAGWNVSGVEPDQNARLIANQTTKKIYDNKEQIPNEKFDVITLWHVLEHVPDLIGTLNFLKNHLSEKGIVFIAVPNPTSYDALHYGSYWAAYDVPRHLYHFIPGTLVHLLAKLDLVLVKTLPMRFDSFYVSMLSEKYKNGSISYLKAFIIGFISNWKASQPTDYSSVIYVLKHKS